MTYRIFKTAKGFWFYSPNRPSVRHGPFTTRKETKKSADQWIKDCWWLNY